MRLLLVLISSLTLALAGCGGDPGGDSGGDGTGTDDTGVDTTVDTGTGGTGDTGGTGTGDTGDTGDTGPDLADTLAAGAPMALDGYARTEGSLQATAGGVSYCNRDEVVIAGEAVALTASCIALATDDASTVVATTDGKWHAISGGAITASIDGPWPLGLALSTASVYAAAGTNGVHASPADLSVAPVAIDGAKDARAITSFSDGRLLVADGVNGISVLGVTGGSEGKAAAPLLNSIASSVAWIDTDQTAVVGFQGFGIGVVDTSGGAPVVVGSLKTDGLVMDVASDGADHVLSADWMLARLFDVSDPASPVLVAREKFGAARAISTAWDGTAFQVAGLDHLTPLTPNVEVMAAELGIERDAIDMHITDEFGTPIGGAGILVANTGRADLHVSNLAVTDPDTEISEVFPSGIEGVDLKVGPGEVEFLELTVNGVEPREFALTFDTNDPDNLSATLTLRVNPTALETGDEAPDFILPSIAGHLIRLADYEDANVVQTKPFNSL